MIWVPVRQADSRYAAETQEETWKDERIMHLWDGEREIQARFARRLGIAEPGWDLYLLYGREARWDGELPPMPSFWMHQLSPEVGADPNLYLCREPERLGRELDRSLLAQ